MREAFDKTFELPAPHGWRGSKAEHHAEINARICTDHFGEAMPLDHIDVAALDKFVLALSQKGNSDATINRKLACLSKAMRVARDRGGCPTLPKFPRAKEGQGRIRFASDQEEGKLLTLLAQWGRTDEAEAFVVLMDTGLRCGELLAAEARDLSQLPRPAVSVWENKGGVPRTIPLTERATVILTRRALVSPAGPLFSITYGRLSDTWDRAKAVMGLAKDEQWVIHALRHTFASRLVQRGVPIPVVQKLMGHKTIQMTMRYAHLAPTDTFNAIAVLDAKPAPALVDTSPIKA